MVGGAVIIGGGVLQRETLAVGVSRAKDAVAGDRVAAAKLRLKGKLEDEAKARGIAWPPREVFVRAFKMGDDGISAGRVEAWVGDGKEPLQLLQSHPPLRDVGRIGPQAPRRRSSGPRRILHDFGDEPEIIISFIAAGGLSEPL